jgi:lipopolysaccharide/colanic/teichoic acid biosynthesis glycosyltransferase
MTTFYRRRGKRLLDLALTIPALILLAPVMGVVALAVWLTMRRPVLFSQMRAGLHGEPFTIYKFRTMTDARDAVGKLLPDAERITPLGRWLRRLKLDELPQLFGVVLGDMSLVGPRPALSDQLAEYDEKARVRLSMRPGLTGLAQINGNIHLPWPERWQYDAEYVKHASLWLDLTIIVKTLVVIVLGENRFVAHPRGETKPR